MGFGINAVELLKAGYRQVEAWFEQFEDSDSVGDKQTLAVSICRALTVSAQLEEEFFYPALQQAVDLEELLNEALVRLDVLRKLIADIEESNPEDEFFEARLRVLSRIFQLHINAQEQAGGMLDEAEGSDLDLEMLGEDMDNRRSELVSDS